MNYPVIPDGAWPILLTPFTLDGTLDFSALDELVDFYSAIKVVGLLVLGQASEVLKLSDIERFAVAERVAARAGGHLRVVAVGNYGVTLAEQAASLTHRQSRC